MNITSVPPSAEAQTILNALQQAVAKNLRKRSVVLDSMR